MNLREKRQRAYQSQLPKSALLVYIYLLDCLKTKGQTIFYINRREICDNCHLSYNALSMALTNLQESQFIQKEKFEEDVRTCLKITIL